MPGSALELLAAITAILDPGQLARDIRSGVAAEDAAAALIGVFPVAPLPERSARAGRLLDVRMEGLRPPAVDERRRVYGTALGSAHTTPRLEICSGSIQ
ncbi:MAG TPA: hypothetical protein VFN61_09220 [Acidimicrobiales bacterium]|nr:hypothetical protein [Acidimicrobiales bacterium]